jgi:hypothetical protein
LVSALTAAGLFVLCSDAEAAGPLAPQGQRITTSKYAVDLYQGPVLATSRIIGLGGAYTAIAENTDGIPFNPAAASFRAPYSHTRADWDLTGGITLPSSVSDDDFDNNGKKGFTYDNFYFLTGGGLIQLNHLGFGVMASFQNYELGAPGGAVPLPGSTEVVQKVAIRVLRADPVMSYGFLDDQLHIGGGLRVAGFFGVGRSGAPGQDASTERLLLESYAVGVQAGGLWAPYDLPLRVGLTIRSPAWNVSSGDNSGGRVPKNADGDRVIGNIYLPEELSLPWEVEAGVAIQLWKRPLNIQWQDEDKVPIPDTERWRQKQPNGEPEASWLGARRLLKAKYKAIPRQRVLLTASTVITGPTANAVGLESMISQTVDRSGQNTVFSIRGGVEGEVIPWWLVVRAGSYLEPTRYSEGAARLHGTAGLDLRVLEWGAFGLFDDDTLWRISLSGDLARDYFGWGFGVGFVH